MGLEGDVEQVSRLYYEMSICSELLGGMKHEDFERLTQLEKLKWYYYYEMKLKREAHFNEKQINAIRNS